ncbi:MAG TPA: hypothetical protein VK548_08515, partial [Candidatus Acidoferrum sp.]|nr:hypothetical protein [Candidatus Acidoferrum sp.]
ATTNATTIVGHEIAADMTSLSITLGKGFRGHTVVIAVDGREMYRRAGLSTDPTVARADVVEIAVASRLIQVVVSATPGDYVGSLELDASAHSRLAISLVGEGTVSLETSV